MNASVPYRRAARWCEFRRSPAARVQCVRAPLAPVTSYPIPSAVEVRLFAHGLLNRIPDSFFSIDRCFRAGSILTTLRRAQGFPVQEGRRFRVSFGLYQGRCAVKQKLRFMMTGLMCITLSGCNVSLPRIFHPGHLYEQQLRATYHDPYGDLDSGPRIPGSRPMEYRAPRAEPVRTQWYTGPFGF